ncbi:MAG: APC family permease [Rhodospirillaceae bacterium]|nr:APC family permease [Rhodospirillaceae bacterium]
MSAPGPVGPRGATPALRRTLGFWLLLFYGIGIIVGAGIYVLVGAVAAQAGMAAPLSFLLAGALAALTGLAYAELVTRLPEASGAVAYVHAATGRNWLARVVGVLVLLIALASAASIARGSAGYVQRFVDVPAWLPGAVVVAVLTVVACVKVVLGARLAALIGMLEVGGLIFAIAIGGGVLGEAPARAAELVPQDFTQWRGLVAGAFIAFFAFLGFEALANMAEETRDVARTLPRAIVAAIVVAAILYGVLALVAVLAVPIETLSRSTAPLCLLLDLRGVDCNRGFAAVALFALSNGVLVEIMLVGRLLYGMARRGLAPAWFGGVTLTGHAPARATLAGGGVVLALVVALPFDKLASATSGLTLVVFTAVNLSLIALKRRDRQASAPPPPVNLPMAIPILGTVACVGLLAVALWP